MRCRDFREHYSDFADGLLEEAAEIACRQHLAECPCCRRLDVAYRLGRGALQHLPSISPSTSFRHRLTARLCEERADAMPALRQWSGVAGAVLLAAAVAVATVELSPGPAAPVSAGAAAAGSPALMAARPAPAWKRLVHLVGDTSFGNPYHLPLLRPSRDSGAEPATPAPSFTVAIDWISP